MLRTSLRTALIPLLVAGLPAAADAQGAGSAGETVPPADGEAAQNAPCPPAAVAADPFNAVGSAPRSVSPGSDPGPRPMIRRGFGNVRPESCRTSPASPADRPAALSVGPLDIALLPAGWRLVTNTGYPRDRNNGVLWEGRGPAAAAHGGLAFRIGPVSGALAPIAMYARNRDAADPLFSAAGESEWHDPLNPTTIDLPRRFGPGSLSLLHPGQSFVRVDAFGAGFGVSTENLWWGPALRYPLIMSNTAPGFPHVFLGTSGPTDIGIGRLHAELVWGHLHESEYYDDDPGNDRRLFAGLALAFQPRGLDGLSLGATRAYVGTIPPEGLSTTEYLERPYTAVRDNPGGLANPQADNQLFSVFGRWAATGSGFEVYGEWAREDHWIDFQDLLREPDHAQAYTIGFRQSIALAGDRRLDLHGEIASLGNSTVGLTVRGGGVYYRHAQVRQGYTHRGQLLGAWIGPRSAEAQFFAVDLLGPAKRVGAYVERIRRDPYIHHRSFASTYGTLGHDVELTGGLRGALPFRAFAVSWEAAYSRRRNRNFIGLRESGWSFAAESNLHAALALTWVPGGGSVGGEPEPGSGSTPGPK